MKIHDLLEDTSGDTIKAKRMMKFSTRKGKENENSFGLDLTNLKCEYFAARNRGVIYIGKPKSLKLNDSYHFENAEKPGFAAYTNSKLGSSKAEITKIETSFDAALALFKGDRTLPVVIVDPGLLTGAKPVEVTAKEEPTNPEDGYFLLSYWNNAYRSNDKEYFWSGPYKDRKDALAFNKAKQKRGQPKTFKDWAEGSATVIKGLEKFLVAAKKAGLNPNVKDLYWHE